MLLVFRIFLVMGSQLNQWLPICSVPRTSSVKGVFSTDQGGTVSCSAWIPRVWMGLCSLVQPDSWWAVDWCQSTDPELRTPELNDIPSVVKFCTSLSPLPHHRDNFIFISHPLLTSFFQQNKVILMAFWNENESMVTVHTAKGV